MADKAKTKSAKERLEAAKKAAVEADVVDPKNADAVEVKNADAVSVELAEAADPSEKPGNEEEGIANSEEGSGNSHSADPEEAVVEPKSPEVESDPDTVAPDLEESAGSIASTILKCLVILFVGAGVALWAGPKVAPNLPGWASPVAAFLTPGVNETAERIDAVAKKSQKKIAELASEVEASTLAAAQAEQKASAAIAAVSEARTDLTAEILDAANEPRADLERMNDLAKRLVSAEATIKGLRAEIDALGNATSEGVAPSAEVLERVAGFGASVEGLRAEIADLKLRTSQIEALASNEDLAALVERVTELENGEAATAGARDEASNIRRSASIDAALTRIEQALLSGAPYADALSETTSLSGESAPNALLSNASSGMPTQKSLSATFPAAAQAAYAAALEEDAGESFSAGVLAKLQGRLGGRPSVETEGADAGAVLSRIEARLKTGGLSDALAEASGLSEGAQGAMANWLSQLARTAEGAKAFAEYRNSLTTN